MKRTLFAVFAAGVLLTLHAGGVLRTGAGGAVKSLDPALADDLAGRDLAALCYDTLVQYDYLARPYRLAPSMITAMPEVSDDRRSYTFELRGDLFFAAGPGERPEPLTAEDVKFSILRIADARIHSPVYWIYRDRIAGIGQFRAATARLAPEDMSVYDSDIPGIRIHSPRKFTLTLDRPDPGFLYLLAMPNAGVVSRRAVLERGQRSLARRPAGSGPFMLKEWIPNLRLRFVRNPGYREEYFPRADSPGDRKRKLPLLDGVEILQIRQPMTAWMLFLQGNLDCNAVDKDNRDTIAGDGELNPALAARGVVMEKIPEFEIRYVGFNFRDPKLGGNLKLRQALREAYDIRRRVEHAAHLLLPAAGPIPAGVGGHVPAAPARHPDREAARTLLAEAGYPGGIDPETGEALHFDFDQGGSSVGHRQLGELAADDWRHIGIRISPMLNSRPRFADKLRRGRFQIFRYSWIGDYPDGGNFLQLFYSGNIGSCNYCGFSDPEFDAMFERSLTLSDGPERTALYEAMVKLLNDRCVWIWEGFPISCVLRYDYLENSVPHDFSFVRWKYLSINEPLRAERRRRLRPLSFAELSGRAAGGRR
ncbi:MAG: ABC transporter substrate-binding protein [Lentisphaeria bacterium]|nr:ABC transporter substrate-binding protein [Lentisphaeria bacterium]